MHAVPKAAKVSLIDTVDGDTRPTAMLLIPPGFLEPSYSPCGKTISTGDFAVNAEIFAKIYEQRSPLDTVKGVSYKSIAI